jgi:hypothetical protein
MRTGSANLRRASRASLNATGKPSVSCSLVRHGAHPGLSDFRESFECFVKAREADSPVFRHGLKGLPHVSRVEGVMAGELVDVTVVAPSGARLGALERGDDLFC